MRVMTQPAYSPKRSVLQHLSEIYKKCAIFEALGSLVPFVSLA